MADARKQYLKEMWNKFRLLGAWHPDSEINVGDVGVMEEWCFQRKRCLSDLAVDFDLADASGSVSSRTHHSTSGVSFRTDTSAASQAGHGEVSLKFENAGGVAFHAARTTEVRMHDIGVIEDRIWELHEAGKWNDSHIVVTKVISAESLVVLVANKRGASATLTAGSEVKITEVTSLASLGAGIGIKSHSNMETAIVAAGPLSPLFEGICLDKHGVLRKRRIAAAKPKRLLAEEQTPIRDAVPDADARFIHWGYDLDDDQ